MRRAIGDRRGQGASAETCTPWHPVTAFSTVRREALLELLHALDDRITSTFFHLGSAKAPIP